VLPLPPAPGLRAKQGNFSREDLGCFGSSPTTGVSGMTLKDMSSRYLGTLIYRSHTM
jgi:hypothetical protein